MLLRSFPQKGSIFGTSSPSAAGHGLCSGEDGVRGVWSCGDLGLLGGGEVEENGGEVVVGVGVWGVGVWGVWADVGLLPAEWEELWFIMELDRGDAKSRPPTLAVMGEWRESFRVRTGEEVRDEMDNGGGEENLRQRRGDRSFVLSVPRLFWLVAKNNSKDLKRGEKQQMSINTRIKAVKTEIFFELHYWQTVLVQKFLLKV